MSVWPLDETRQSSHLAVEIRFRFLSLKGQKDVVSYFDFFNLSVLRIILHSRSNRKFTGTIPGRDVNLHSKKQLPLGGAKRFLLIFWLAEKDESITLL